MYISKKEETKSQLRTGIPHSKLTLITQKEKELQLSVSVECEKRGQKEWVGIELENSIN